MKSSYPDQPNGYLETIQKGLAGIRSLRGGLTGPVGTPEENFARLKQELETADAIVIGAGAGLSTAAGLTYSGERFERYFFDFARRFGIRDIYAGGFYPFPDAETRWAWWARHIYYNRYIDPPKPVYPALLSLLEGKEFFVVTTNVDHQFRRAGFDRTRLFYTQGDYGLFQDEAGRIPETWDNETWVMQAMDAQGFVRDGDGVFQVPENKYIWMRIPSGLIPTSPNGGPVTMNLRSDDTFVEDAGWHRASAAYADFLRRNADTHVLYWEIGVGSNTPVIVKYPFWQLTKENPRAVYACLNYDEAVCPQELAERSICIEGDANAILEKIIHTETTL